VAAGVEEVEPDRELFTAWRRRVAGSVTVCVAPEFVNKPFASTSCWAAWLNCTMPVGAAFSITDFTAEEDRTEESDPVDAPERV
jgi:hypothetical protein